MSTTTPETVVIVGASLAGGTAAFAAREAGFEGRILLIGAEPHLPYGRPPLSKSYLRGEGGLEDYIVRPEPDYGANRIETLLSTRVTAIDALRHRVVLDGGDEVEYSRLVVATGGRNRSLPLPGHDLPGVLALRTIEDSDAIREAAAKSRRVVVAGMGFIGSEVAASLRTLGLEVTAVAGALLPLERVLGPEFGQVLATMHREHGTELVIGEEVAAFEGSGRVERVRTRSGRILECDFVVTGFGIQPNLELLQEAGARIDNGVVVDEYCGTSLPDISAAGDVANRYHPLFKERMRLEHWNNGDRQGRIAGQNVAGRPEAYSDIPSFWSDQYEEKIEYVGHHTRYDQLVIRGDTGRRSFFAYYLLAGVVRAVATMGQGDDVVPTLEKQVLQPLPSGS
jgi:3-phenylpropionate/trans-cinnamate dioxygenase ferredoxin reductase subunit